MYWNLWHPERDFESSIFLYQPGTLNPTETFFYIGTVMYKIHFCTAKYILIPVLYALICHLEYVMPSNFITAKSPGFSADAVRLGFALSLWWFWCLVHHLTHQGDNVKWASAWCHCVLIPQASMYVAGRRWGYWIQTTGQRPDNIQLVSGQDQTNQIFCFSNYDNHLNLCPVFCYLRIYITTI